MEVTKAFFMQIYVNRNNQQLGPYTEEELKTLLATGTLSAQDHAWWQGQATWVPLSQTPFAASLPGGTPPIPGTPAAYPGNAYATTSNMAIWSLVCACLIPLCSLLSAIPAIILGHLSLGEIKRNPGMKGRGMALAGLIIGYSLTLILIFVIAISVLIALGNQVKSTTLQIQEKQSSSDSGDIDQPKATPSDSNTNSTPAITP